MRADIDTGFHSGILWERWLKLLNIIIGHQLLGML